MGEVAHQQHPDPGRAAELVPAGGDEIGLRKRELAGALRAVGEQERPRLADA